MNSFQNQMPMRYRITDSKKKKKLIECLKKYDRKRFLSTVTYRLMPWEITVQQQTVNCVHFPEVFLPGKKKKFNYIISLFKKQCPQFPFVDCTQSKYPLRLQAWVREEFLSGVFYFLLHQTTLNLTCVDGKDLQNLFQKTNAQKIVCKGQGHKNLKRSWELHLDKTM